MSLDHLYDCAYNAKTYNCVHFLCDAWREVTGEDLASRMGAFFADVADMKAERKTMRDFQRLRQPESPCIVFLKNRNSSHVGLFLRQKVLHLGVDGVQFLPLSVLSVGFEQVRFYK